MKNNSINIILFSIILLLSSCGNCEKNVCFTPPNELVFSLVDKGTGEDFVFGHGIDSTKVKLYPRLQNTSLPIPLEVVRIDESLLFFAQGIGWNTGEEKSHYELRIGDLAIKMFTYFSVEVSEDCCTHYETKEFAVEDAEILQREVDKRIYFEIGL